MEAIHREDDHDEKVRGEEGSIEGEELPVVKVLEGAVAIMGAEVVAEVVFNVEEAEGLGEAEQADGGGREHEDTGYRG
jgi:hypothetical protein